MTESIENKLRTELQSYLRTNTAYESIVVLSEYNQASTDFPCVVLSEKDNRSYTPTNTANGEQHSVLMYQVDWFSTKKEELKKIAIPLCEFFEQYRFTRNSMGMVDNLLDNNIKRMVARFTVLHGKDDYLYQA